MTTDALSSAKLIQRSRALNPTHFGWGSQPRVPPAASATNIAPFAHPPPKTLAEENRCHAALNTGLLQSWCKLRSKRWSKPLLTLKRAAAAKPFRAGRVTTRPRYPIEPRFQGLGQQ
jgi:hypothetical protein